MSRKPSHQQRLARLEELQLLAFPGGGVVGPLFPQPTALMGSQIVDPQNATGVASTSGAKTATVTGADGNTYTGPVWLHYRDLVNAWGTYAPYITQPTTIVFASSHKNSSDPVVLDVLNSTSTGNMVTFMGVATGGTAATFTQATARNRTAGANSALSGSGPTVVGQFLQNTTHPSVAWALRVTSGANHLITQPMVATNVTVGTYTQTPLYGTWSSADAILLIQPVAIFFVYLRSRNASDTQTGGALNVFGCVALDPSLLPGTGVLTVDASTGQVNFVQVRVDTILNVQGQGATGQPSFFATNCYFAGNISVEGGFAAIGGAINCAAGSQSAGFLSSTTLEAVLDGDLILTGGGSTAQLVLGSDSGGVLFGLVCLDLHSSTVNVNAGVLLVEPLYYSLTTVYGSTTTNADNISALGTSRIVFDAATKAVGCFTFPLAILGGMLFNNQQGELAYVSTNMGVGTIHTNQSSQVAAIDAVIAGGAGGLSSLGLSAAGASIAPSTNS